MHIRTFRAANLQAALAEIRDQMGENASVLHTRQIRAGWLGWLGRTSVEVTAGLRDEIDPAHPREDQALDTSVTTSDVVPQIVDLETHLADQLPNTGQPIDQTFAEPSARFSVYPTDELDDPLSLGAGKNSGSTTDLSAEIVSWISRSNPGTHSDGDGPHEELFMRELIRCGVAHGVAARWLASASSFAAGFESADTSMNEDESGLSHHPWLRHLRRAVARELNLCGPIRTQPGERHVVALIGPTGVGKTTTIAKLAAGFRIESRRRVGLLTIDTYRIAAVEQLRAYADIMDLPMQVVERPSEMETALAQLGDVDLVLIDTAGRNPRSDARIDQLTQFLHAARPDETHLVLSATSSTENLKSQLLGFEPTGPTSVILTKLDEAPCTAGVLSVLANAERSLATPMSYVTNGQQVPDDIAIADASQMINMLLPPMSPWMDSAAA